VFESVPRKESILLEGFKAELDICRGVMATGNAVLAMKGSPQWKVYESSVREMASSWTSELLREQDPHQKFRISGKVEAIGLLIRIMDDAVSEASRAKARAEEIEEFLSKAAKGSRLDPAARKWQP
jgi:hypothetical protein